MRSHDLSSVGPACDSRAWGILQKDRAVLQVCFRFVVGILAQRYRHGIRLSPSGFSIRAPKVDRLLSSAERRPKRLGLGLAVGISPCSGGLPQQSRGWFLTRTARIVIGARQWGQQTGGLGLGSTAGGRTTLSSSWSNCTICLARLCSRP